MFFQFLCIFLVSFLQCDHFQGHVCGLKCTMFSVSNFYSCCTVESVQAHFQSTTQTPSTSLRYRGFLCGFCLFVFIIELHKWSAFCAVLLCKHNWLNRFLFYITITGYANFALKTPRWHHVLNWIHEIIWISKTNKTYKKNKHHQQHKNNKTTYTEFMESLQKLLL